MKIFAKSHFHERGQMCLRASFYFWLWARAASLWSSARVFECEQNALWSRCPPERWIFELEMYQNYLSHRFSLIKSIIIRLKARVYEILILILTIQSLNITTGIDMAFVQFFRTFSLTIRVSIFSTKRITVAIPKI